MAAFLYALPAGIAGDVVGIEAATLEPSRVDTTNTPTGFGTFVKKVAGKLQGLAASDAATVISGILVRAFPTQQASQNPALGSSAVNTAALHSVLKRGYIMAALGFGTAVDGAQVYVRTVVGASGRAVGTIETAADTGNCVAVANCFFTGPADAGGIVKLAYNI